jgi:hypothetical protein
MSDIHRILNNALVFLNIITKKQILEDYLGLLLPELSRYLTMTLRNDFPESARCRLTAAAEDFSIFKMSSLLEALHRFTHL